MTKTERRITKVLFEMLETVKSEKRKLEIVKLILELNRQNRGLGGLSPGAARLLGVGKRPAGSILSKRDQSPGGGTP